MPIGRPFRRAPKRNNTSRPDLSNLLRSELKDTARKLEIFAQELRKELDERDPPEVDSPSSSTGD